MDLTQQTKLNTRQWALYNLIKQRTIEGVKTTCADICESLPEHYQLNKNQTHHYSNCPEIYKDCEELNLSSEIEKVVVVGNNDFHIAKDEQEAMSYARSLAKRAAHRFKRYWAIADKVSKDGQGKLISCHGDEITDESKARRFVEAFLSERNHDADGN